MSSKFTSTVLIHPGMGNSGEQHWQSIWEQQHPEFIRINQRDWQTPTCQEWIENLDREVIKHNPANIILVGHSLACTTIIYWANRYKRIIKGALLVGPSDTEADTYPLGTTGFNPIPLVKLPFRSIVVMSSNDPYVTPVRAQQFANSWGSELVNIGDAGHINAVAGYGRWDFGLELLEMLERKSD